jgi:hypothetical protein
MFVKLRFKPTRVKLLFYPPCADFFSQEVARLVHFTEAHLADQRAMRLLTFASFGSREAVPDDATEAANGEPKAKAQPKKGRMFGNFSALSGRFSKLGKTRERARSHSPEGTRARLDISQTTVSDGRRYRSEKSWADWLTDWVLPETSVTDEAFRAVDYTQLDLEFHVPELQVSLLDWSSSMPDPRLQILSAHAPAAVLLAVRSRKEVGVSDAAMKVSEVQVSLLGMELTLHQSTNHVRRLLPWLGSQITAALSRWSPLDPKTLRELVEAPPNPFAYPSAHGPGGAASTFGFAPTGRQGIHAGFDGLQMATVKMAQPIPPNQRSRGNTLASERGLDSSIRYV